MGHIRFRRFKQFHRYNTRRFWKEEMDYAKKTFPFQPIPAVIQNIGIKLEDPNHPDFPRKTALDPIEINHPAWPKSTAPQLHPWYRPSPGYVFTGEHSLAEGVNHASVISKAVVRRGLPESILKSADWLQLAPIKEKVEQMILHSQRWDATVEKLPIRRDPTIWWHHFERYWGIPQERKNELLLDNLHRLVQVESRNAIGQFKLSRYVRKAPINVSLERSGNTICLNMTPHLTISHPTRIAALEGPMAVQETTNESLADIHPVLPINDLEKTNIINPNLLTPFSWSSPPQFIHTIIMHKVNDTFYPWTPNEISGRATMAAFAAALSSAKLMYPETNGQLAEPITAQCVHCCGGTFDFVVFQLNTMDFAQDSGIKNIVYLDSGNQLFETQEHWKPYDQVKEYNPEVLKKLVAVLSNGVWGGK